MPNLPWEDENVRPLLLKSGVTPSDLQFQNIGKGNRNLRNLFIL